MYYFFNRKAILIRSANTQSGYYFKENLSKEFVTHVFHKKLLQAKLNKKLSSGNELKNLFTINLRSKI